MSRLDPQHPGQQIRRQCLEPFGLTVADGARVLGITRQALNNVVNGKAGISPEMAIRLVKAFGGEEEAWLQLQMAYDLAQARKRAHGITVRPVSERPHVNPQPRLL